jgi:hypothetical protein
VAQGQLVQNIATGDFSGTTGVLTDAPVAIAAANLYENGTTNFYHYVFTAGTAALSSTNTFFQVVRYSPFTFGGQVTGRWPSDVSSLGDAAYVLEGMAKVPLQQSGYYAKGTTRLYLAGHGPGAPGHTDLIVVGLDEDLTLKWTYRVQHDEAYPVYIYASPVSNRAFDCVAVGTTVVDPTYTGADYRVYVLRGSDGAELTKFTYSSPGNHGDVLKAVAVNDLTVFAAGTGYSAADGKSKYVTAAYDWESGSGVTNLLDVPGYNDGRNYDVTAMAIADRLGSASQLVVTGTVEQGSLDHPTWHNYFTVGMAPTNSPMSQILWSNEYDGLGGGDDVPAAVQIAGDAGREGSTGDSYTWVTGRSRGLTGNDDVVTILYNYTQSGLQTVWKARWYNYDSMHTGNLTTDQGVALSWDFDVGDTIYKPYIYVLAQTQNLTTGVLDSVYLSYDIQGSSDAFERKVTRWQQLYTDPLPADCFYHSSSGNTYPAALTVINDPHESTLTDYMFRTHTAPSLMAGNGYDFISTAELDNEP